MAKRKAPQTSCRHLLVLRTYRLFTLMDGSLYPLQNPNRKITYLDGWKPVPLPESTQSRSGPYGTEPDTNISPFEFPEISYWLDIKYIVLSVSFCQAQVAFVSNKLVMLCQFHHYSSVSTYKGSDWYRATKSDYFPAGAVRHSE